MSHKRVKIVQTQNQKNWHKHIPRGIAPEGDVAANCDLDTPEPKRSICEWDKEYALPGLAHMLKVVLRAEWTTDESLSKRIEEKEHDALLSKLENLAQAGNERAFLAVLKEVEWENRPAKDFICTIKLALRAGAHLAARQVSSDGLKHYPDDPDMQKYARGLAPPEVISRDLPPNPTLAANREWLKTHSNMYRGQWVAVRNGNLLGASSSLKELTTQFPERENTLFTKVR